MPFEIQISSRHPELIWSEQLICLQIICQTIHRKKIQDNSKILSFQWHRSRYGLSSRHDIVVLRTGHRYLNRLGTATHSLIILIEDRTVKSRWQSSNIFTILRILQAKMPSVQQQFKRRFYRFNFSITYQNIRKGEIFIIKTKPTQHLPNGPIILHFKMASW